MNRSNAKALIITLSAFTFVGIAFGFHYGWLDDVQDLNIMKGPFVNGCTLFDPDHFTFIQKLLQWLYGISPKFPWFGSMLYALLAYAIYTSTNLLLIRAKIGGTKTKMLVALLFIVCFLLEHINAINFTSVAVLVSGVAIVNWYFFLSNNQPNIKNIATFLLPWVVALLIRREVVFFCTAVIVVILFIQTPSGLYKKYIPALGLMLFTSIALLGYVKLYQEKDEEYKRIASFNAYLFTIQEAYQVKSDSLKTEEDSLVCESVRNWNYFDNKKFKPALLQKIGYESPIRLELLYNLPARLRSLVSESFKYNKYREIYNWDKKLVFVLFINMLLLLFQIKSRLQKIRQFLLSHFIFWFSMIAVGVIVKMENRLFYPMCAIYTLLNLLATSIAGTHNEKKYWNKITLWVCFFALFICLLFSSFMFYQNVIFAKELNDELEIKRALWKELTKLKNKIIVYDYHSLMLLHDLPFREINLPRNNENIVANHLYLTHFNCLNEYYLSRIGSSDIDSVMSYLYTQRQNVYFVALTYDLDFLHRYMKGIYHIDYSFKRSAQFHTLDKMDHNFLWMPLNYAVFRFEEKDTAMVKI